MAKKELMEYFAEWEYYERCWNHPTKRFKFRAASDEEALFKCFKKICLEEESQTFEEFCKQVDESMDVVKTKQFLIQYFNDIDITGFHFLRTLNNLTTKEEVYNVGLEDGDYIEELDDDY